MGAADLAGLRATIPWRLTRTLNRQLCIKPRFRPTAIAHHPKRLYPLIHQTSFTYCQQRWTHSTTYRKLPQKPTEMSYPETIKAIVLTGTGDFDVIKKVDVPFPTPAGNELLIKIGYFGVNFIDSHFRKGTYPAATFPFGVGVEGSGTIVALPTDPGVLSNEDYKKRNFSVGAKVAILASSTAREYLAVNWSKAFVVPNNVSLELAAAANAQGSTAVSFIEEAYDVKKGDTVLIHTVAGGLGLLLTQLAKLRGATVIGTTSSAEKAKIAKENGADHVILYRDEDVASRVLEITGGVGVEGIFDGVGKDTYEIDFKVIKRKGTIVFVGNASGPIPPISPLKLAEKNVKIIRPSIFNYIHTPEEFYHYFSELFTLVANGQLKINVHKVYGFTEEEVQQTDRDLIAGKTVGKLVVKVSDD